jgi:hypothetical protein
VITAAAATTGAGWVRPGERSTAMISAVFVSMSRRRARRNAALTWARVTGAPPAN